MRRPERRHSHRFAFEIADRLDALGSEQLEASRVDAAQERDRRLQIQLDHEARNEPHANIDLLRPYGAVDKIQRNIDILNIMEAFDFEQALADVLRRNTDAGDLGEPDGGDLGWALLRRRSFTAEQGPGSG